MKNDREFLDGIYEKARLLSSETGRPRVVDMKIIKRKSVFTTKARTLIAAAAVFMLIAVPDVIYAGQPNMQIPKGYSNLAPVVAKSRVNEGSPPQTGDSGLIEYSDVICSAKVLKIEKSVYDKENQRIITNVQVKPTVILKGEPVEKVLTIQVNGGFDEKSKSYSDYEAVFARGEDVLVFLNEIPNSDSYILYGSTLGKYTYDSSYANNKTYVDCNSLTVTVEGLTNVLS